jgi:hypothetical protein
MVKPIRSKHFTAKNIRFKIKSFKIQKFKIQMVNIICSEWIPAENIWFEIGKL